MPIPFRCEQCNATGKAGSRFAGQLINCPRCQALVKVPATAEMADEAAFEALADSPVVDWKSTPPPPPTALPAVAVTTTDPPPPATPVIELPPLPSQLPLEPEFVEERDPVLIPCKYCFGEVSPLATKCRHCGEYLSHELADKVRRAMAPPKWSPGVAGVLSMFLPGAGHVYRGDVMSGIILLALTIIGYAFFVIPGVIMHLIVINSAMKGDPYQWPSRES